MKIELQKVQVHLDWLKQLLYLDSISVNAKNRIVKRGQVYNCELGIGVGTELQKNRPCVVFQNDIGNIKSPKTVVIPITHTYKEHLSCFVPISDKYDKNGNVILDGQANVSEIRAVDKARLGDYICDLDNQEMKAIEIAAAQNLDMYRHYKAMENMYNDKIKYVETLNKTLKEVKQLLEAENNSEIITKLKKLLDKPEEK